MKNIAYPPSPTVNQIDHYHGTAVPDPYRWLEETDSPETLSWIQAQNDVSSAYLADIPGRQAIQDRLAQIWNFPKRTAPKKKGDHFFQLRNSGLQNQSVLFVMDAPGGEGRVLLDPNTLSEDGTVALNTWSISPNGKLLAYALASSGSDWITWRVREVASGLDLPDELLWSKFSGAAWRADSSGFYYSRYAAPVEGQDFTGTNYYQKLYFHRLHTSQDVDELVYERPDEMEWGFNAEVTHDGAYLIIYVWQGTDVRNRLYVQDLQNDGPIVPLIDELEAAFDCVGNDGPRLYLRTNLDAPRQRVIAVDLAAPDKVHWQTIIAEVSDTLEAARIVHDEFVLVYLHDAHHRLVRADRNGTLLGEIDLPALGALSPTFDGLDLTGERAGSELFFGFMSFLFPSTIYRFDFKTGNTSLIFQPKLDLDASLYETRQVFAPGKDGTRIPIFLTHRKGLQTDGNNPTLLYGYGGFNISMTPAFNLLHMAWIEMGGVLAWSILRGGGEYGEEWHQAGMIHTKQNVFDDFIACAEYLVAEKITHPEKLGIMGRSNGGLLVGACMTQRPDLFGVALPAVGVLDMLRFHKFTIGWAWVSDYGSAEDPEQFETLLAYSPYHNVKPGQHYPATLVTTADHDDRVVPGHSFKFTAALQAAQAGDAPVLIRVDTKAGHGMGKPTAMLVAESADILAFLDHHLCG